MGMSKFQFEDLKEILEEKKCKIVSLGYPTLHVTKMELHSIFGNMLTNFSENNSYKLFEKLGHELTTIDFIKHEGTESHVDLNYPIDNSLHEKWDLVIDPGTIEHCFNIGQAMINVASLVKEGGYVYGVNPLVMINHGYYGIHPRTIYEFYVKNDFEILDMKIREFNLKDNFPVVELGINNILNRFKLINNKEYVISYKMKKIKSKTFYEFPEYIDH